MPYGVSGVFFVLPWWRWGDGDGLRGMGMLGFGGGDERDGEAWCGGMGWE